MKNIINQNALLVLATSSLLLTGCADPLGLHKDKERAVQPQNEAETGFMVSGACKAELGELLSEHPNARFRRVNEKHCLYEVYNLDKETLVDSLPEADVSKNEFIYTFANEKPNPAEMFELLANEEAPAEEDKRLKKCVKDFVSPTAEITTLSPKEDLEDGVVDLGTSLKLSSKESTAHEDQPSELKSAWIVLAPEGSKQRETIIFEKNLEFTPDTYGMYNIMLVVQDERAVCATADQRLVVTGNKSYAGAEVDVTEDLDAIDMAQFHHLDKIQAKESWVEADGKDVLIAVVDSGVNYNHPALLHNIHTLEGEIPDNGVDDDNNGFKDDVVGWDFSNNDAFPYDDQGHGSHVSGLAASDVWGLAQKAKVLPIKALGPSGGDIASIVGGILYAVDSGADIINMSFGSYSSPHPKLVEAMDYAEEKGVVVIAASGNGHPMLGMGVNTDRMPNFPSALPNDNIIAVAASYSGGELAPYSNYGVNTVDVVAPGGLDPDDLLMSAYLDNPAGIHVKGMSGTSMAAPIVAGIAAQILSINPELTAEEVKDILMTTGPEVKELKDYVQSSRRVDALEAILKAKEGVGPVLASASLNEAPASTNGSTYNK